MPETDKIELEFDRRWWTLNSLCTDSPEVLSTEVNPMMLLSASTISSIASTAKYCRGFEWDASDKKQAYNLESG